MLQRACVTLWRARVSLRNARWATDRIFFRYYTVTSRNYSRTGSQTRKKICWEKARTRVVELYDFWDAAEPGKGYADKAKEGESSKKRQRVKTPK